MALQFGVLFLCFLFHVATCLNAATVTVGGERGGGVHSFFYLWYGTPEVDGNWSHWNHHLIPHWTESVRAQYPPQSVHWLPPHDLHSPFYPLHGPYSSRDLQHTRGQMVAMREAGIECAVASWWGRPGHSGGDSQGVLTDDALGVLLEAAALEGVGVAFHLEPYEGRSVESLRSDLSYLHTRFGEHPGLYRARGGKPWFYVYDSYHISPAEWRRLLTARGDLTVRHTELDGVFIGLWLERQHGAELADSGFDGSYTYFATEGFSFGSSPSNWPSMARQHPELLFVPCVGPGYDDSRIRPWNSHNHRARNGGEYYKKMWEQALASGPDFVGVTSFNEWGEGTQIEPARPQNIMVDTLAAQGQALPWDLRRQLRQMKESYEDYSPSSPSLYLQLTADYARKLQQQQQQQHQHQEEL